MFNRGIFQRQLATFVVALMVSTIAIGAAVGPGANSAAAARPLIAVTYA